MWLVGHSYVYWAERHPLARRGSTLLGGKEVRWLGVRGMRLCSFWRFLLDQESRWGRPHWLVVHLGGNDLGQLTSIGLILRLKELFQRVRIRWPEVQLVWSDIVPRSRWRGARDVVALDGARKKVNCAVSQWVVAHGGVAVRHPLLVVQSPWLFWRDGVHLSEEGTRIFLRAIFSALV